MTGEGVAEFFQAVEASREEYEKCVLSSFTSVILTLARREYLPELARVRAQREATLQKQKEDSTARMLADLAVDRASNPNFAAQDRWNPDEEEEDDGGELNIIDKSASISGNGSLFPSSFRLSCHAMPSIPAGITGSMLSDRCRRGLFGIYSIPFPLLASSGVLCVLAWRLRTAEGGRRVGYASSPVLFMRFFFFIFVF